MGLGRCVVTYILCTGMQKKFHALWSLNLEKNISKNLFLKFGKEIRIL